ncbi:BAAT / Acyl-CoA thioester hydrolase C terminal [Ruminococcus sp. YE71]|uniref:acyl-CoA thioester hydrolase/BAAT C-terminal domain-containing protein n=1 Tax=unclassified Ruminococcus TaxID=2608920 RepID=UPI000880DBC4|nr:MULTISPECIES: acyl-CoA thioester hydrolase/BAAT C-terminal domain-containing protein [unclassified Ruminococcus]SDA31774.1 BAAT / Acyl-CoA thioester hydrolase C terminal [Ruminococcus sp. YE78]SFW51948.1 BAAT / Acyl-CoA thioester hydrolase C terminal [Ruminococcus sp. YE71]
MSRHIDFTIEADGFRGRFYKGCRENCAVIFVGGFGISEMMSVKSSQFLLESGYSVMVLGLYLWEGLSKDMWHIPVEYAERAAAWLAENGHGRIAVVGISTGAAYALLSASKLPQITCAVAVSPFDHVMEGARLFGERTGRSVYCFRGEDVPFSRFTGLENGWGRPVVRAARRHELADFSRKSYESAELSEESRIRTEDINGGILLICPDNDEFYPSDEAVTRIVESLRASGFGHRVKALRYKGASHALGSWCTDEAGVKIFLRTHLTAERKRPIACAEARRKSTLAIVDFLDSWAEEK